jgi:hypothetical protein
LTSYAACAVRPAATSRDLSAKDPGGWRYLALLGLTQSIQFGTILNLILAGPASTR